MNLKGMDSALFEELSMEHRTRREKEVGQNNELGQDAFLRLMITQMENQDPLDPQKNSEFVAQLAQFTSVESLQKLNGTVSGLVSDFQSGRALQASSMVGRAVTVPTEHSILGEGGAIVGSIDLPESTPSLNLRVYSADGQLVWQQELGAQEAGELPFAWDGSGPDGSQLPPGEYRFEALGRIDGETEQLETFLSANVNSVTLGSDNTMTLNLAGLGPTPLSEVREVL